jgi:hypothetical protein
MDTQIAKAVISVELDNISKEEAIKLKDYFIRLADAQIHRYGPGKMILHFDKDKNLREIEVDYPIWKV